MIEYKIKEKNENPLDTVIEKTGQSISFTLRGAEDNKISMEKMLKEFKAQLDLDSAKMKNIEDHHPFVLDMSEQDLFTVHMYMESKVVVKKLPEKIEQTEQALARYKDESAEIFKQIPSLSPEEPKKTE